MRKMMQTREGGKGEQGGKWEKDEHEDEEKEGDGEGVRIRDRPPATRAPAVCPPPAAARPLARRPAAARPRRAAQRRVVTRSRVRVGELLEFLGCTVHRGALRSVLGLSTPQNLFVKVKIANRDLRIANGLRKKCVLGLSSPPEPIRKC